MKLSDYLRWNRDPKQTARNPFKHKSSGYLKDWENPTTINRVLKEAAHNVKGLSTDKPDYDQREQSRQRQLRLLSELIKGN